MNRVASNQNPKPGDRQSQAAVRQILSAVDQLIVAAKQAELAQPIAGQSGESPPWLIAPSQSVT